MTHPFQVHVNGVAVYLVKKSLRGLGRSPPLEPGPPHDDVHVLGKGVGVEGLGERVARDAVGGEVSNEDLALLLHGVDIHVPDRDVLRSWVERLVVRARDVYVVDAGLCAMKAE